MGGTLVNDVKDAFQTAVEKAFPNITFPVTVAPSAPRFGDYQCNSAMALFKAHKAELQNGKSPYDVAKLIEQHLPGDIFSNVSVAKQGFVSVTLADNYLERQLRRELRQELGTKVEPLKCLVDYSSPNIAKEMHVGHLRSTIIGETMCRLLEFYGHTVLRVNHLGDWGTQFGMLIEYMTEKYPNFQENPPALTDLTTFYRNAKKRFDDDPAFKKRAQLAVPKLQGGDPVARSAWKLFCDVSRKDFQLIYDRFKVSLIERGESFYNDMIPEVVEELRSANLLSESEGALIMFVENDTTPLIVVKGDGGYGYDSTDLAAIKHRLVVEGHNRVLVTTDVGQETHFRRIFKAAQMIGWYDPVNKKQSCEHVGFGLVQGEDGKKFKTRSGDVVKLTDLLDEAVDRARKEIESRRAEEAAQAAGAPDSDGFEAPIIPVQEAAEAIGYAAIRYFDLKQNRGTSYRFSFDKMLDPKGNTAVYLLYAYARICAIFRKAKTTPEQLDESKIALKEPAERALVLQMLRLYEILDLCISDMELHRIADFMYDLAGAFTSFYQTCKVVGSEHQESRLWLCEFTRRFLGKAFHLFGITPLLRI